MSFLALVAVDAVAQTPVSASGDTLKAGVEEAKPTTAPPQAPPTAAPVDTMTAAQRIRRERASAMTYALSIGVGSSLNIAPEPFTDEYDPSFGLLVDFGVRRWDLEASLSFDYNFFFATGTEPVDINVLTMFLNLKLRPLKTTARPYLIGCAGYFRSWIVNDLDPANPPQTVETEVTGGDNEYLENVLGYGGGAGVEVEIDKTRRIFLEARYVIGQTRQTYQAANMELVPVRIGLTWEFR
jgi:hypothetical protein